ncbi:hypothetical protein DYB36_000701 [Aphanomyces astaci]|uniref:MalT-like TPR region domain-containing protein n=1 Tax=Aphanomyces astaci TaxID=112090 RepID=A0A397BGT9_APHAT|nr:hypothetical protein DYB36_000701 [Aphanomyces astaci]
MCEFCTTAAADALRRNDMDHARRLLSKANALSTQDDVLAIDILNQLACYYRRAAKLRVAYDYLKKAMAIDRRLHPPCPAKAAETRLNACAILSQLGRHDKALELAQAALILLQTQAMGAPAVEKTNAIDVFAAQAVAHHNIAVEEEFLQKPAQSLHSYRRAVSLAAVHCGDSHPLTTELAASLAAAEAALAHKKKHKLFKGGRDSQVTVAYAAAGKSPSAKAKSVPQATKKAYGMDESTVSTQALQAELEPKKAVNMDQFDSAAFADNFDASLVATVDQAATGGVLKPEGPSATDGMRDGLMALLTPRGRAGDESRGDGGATADSKAATEAKTSTEFEDETRDVNELRLDDDEHGEADHRIADEKEGPNPLEHEHTNDAPTYTGDEDDDVGEAKAEAKERMMDALDKESMKATEKPGDGHVVNVNAHEDDVGLEGDDTSYDDGGDQLIDLSDDDEGKHDDVADTKMTSA